MPTRLLIRGRFQEEESLLTLKEVYYFINLGRTLLKWRPRRFGGGLGDLRLTKEEAKKHEQLQRQKRESRA